MKFLFASTGRATGEVPGIRFFAAKSRFDTSHSWQAAGIPARAPGEPLLPHQRFKRVAGRLANGEVVESSLPRRWYRSRRAKRLERSADHGQLVEAQRLVTESIHAAQVRGMVFQAGREPCMNAVKHAQASSIDMRLRMSRDGSGLILTVHDDGVGFDPDTTIAAKSTSGFGLFSVRERLSGDGVELVIESYPGGGAPAPVCVPLRAP